MTNQQEELDWSYHHYVAWSSKLRREHAIFVSLEKGKALIAEAERRIPDHPFLQICKQHFEEKGFISQKQEECLRAAWDDGVREQRVQRFQGILDAARAKKPISTFIDSCEGHLKSKGYLSKNQIHWLEKIADGKA